MRRVALVIALASLGACRCEHQRSVPASDAAETTIAAEPLRQRMKVPAVAWAIFGDRTTEGAAGGDPVSGARMAVDARFLVASIAKLVVATAVMQLVEKKLLDLDAGVSTYLDFVVENPHHRSRAITLRQLLAHTSTIHDDFAKLAPVDAGALPALGPFLRDYLRDEAVWSDQPPGAAFAYSNVGAAVAAYAVERVTKKSFATATTESIFRPLGMNATTWGAPKDGKRASSYATLADGGYRNVDRGPYPVYPVVDLWSTVSDVARFGRAMLAGGGGILPAASVDEMMHEQWPEQGLGWQLRLVAGAFVVGHEGEDRGASTAFFLDRKRGRGAVLFTNGDAFESDDRDRTAAFVELLEILLGRR